MSTLRSATGRTWMAFLLAAALVVAGYAALIGPSAAFAQESPPAATVVPRDNESPSEAIPPTSDEDGTEQIVIAPAPDEVAPAEEQQPTEEGTPEDASGQELIAPAPDAAEGEDLIAPAPKGESGDDGTSWWLYGLLAGVGLAAVAGTGTLAWRLRRHRA
jgi:hypothetical protein